MALLARLNSVFFNKVILTSQRYTILQFHSLGKNVTKTQAVNSQKRNFYPIFKPKTQRDIKIADNIPDEHVMIYRNTMTKYMTWVQVVLVTTSVLVAFCFSINTNIKTYDSTFDSWENRANTQIENEALIYLFAFFTIVVATHIFITRTPVRIYKNPGTSSYILISPGNFPLTTSRIDFKRGDINPVEVTGVLPWRHFRYSIQQSNDDKRVILLDQYFRRPADLHIMLGEQSDPDVEKK